jgi:hypothetical protein
MQISPLDRCSLPSLSCRPGFNCAVCASSRVSSRLCCNVTAVKICTYTRHGRDHRYTDAANRSPMVRSPAQTLAVLSFHLQVCDSFHMSIVSQNHSIKYYGDKRRRLFDMIQKRFYLLYFPKLFVVSNLPLPLPEGKAKLT